MELRDALLKRRSVRKFTEDKVSDEDINELLIAAMSGPSAVNKRPWEFYVITNKDKLEELRAHGAPFGKMLAPLAIVVCGNLAHALPLKLADYWIQDCSAATENILLRATDLGLGAVWCGVYPNKGSCKNVRKVIGASILEIPLNVIWIGHPSEEKEARSQFDDKKVHKI